MQRATFLFLASCQRNAHLISVAVAVSANAEMLDLGDLILVAFITGNSSLEPLIEGLYAQIHVNLR